MLNGLLNFKLPSLFDLLLFNGSRKVGLGLWILILTNLYFFWSMISVETWQGMTLLSSALIGGGTVADKLLEKKNEPKT